MDTEKKMEMVKTTVRIPEHLIKDLKEAGKKHYRNFNSELIFAIEQYLVDWKNKH
jgi:metal-responsive CopG/Arc/MetJ family transcriptional regulator